MEKSLVVEALGKLGQDKKRNFSQSFDLIVTLKDLDLKKNENQVDFFHQLPNGTGKQASICAFVDNQMAGEARAVFDEVILSEDFSKYKDKKVSRKLARKFDFFVAQANLMAQVATFFGRALGPKGKMPNPKAGCVIAPKASLKLLKENLQKTVRVSAKLAPMIQVIVGTEKMGVEKTAENVVNLYEQIVHHLPNEEANVKGVYVKLTMSSPVKLK